MSDKPELSLELVEGELQPVGGIPTVTVGKVKAIAILAKVSTIEALANQMEVTNRIGELQTAYSPDIERTKSSIGEVKTMADFKRADSLRLAVREKRLEFSKTADAAFKQNKALVDNAKIGKSAVEDFLKGIESDLESALSDKENELKAEAACKKAIADAVAKLKNYTINPLLPVTDIVSAIDDFRLAFGDTNYQESQDAADTIFESKMVEFKAIMVAAVTREENERKVKAQEEQAQQRANIGVTFPIAEISGYNNRTASDIQARMFWTAKVDMIAFELVLSEAETAKQSCLNMLNAFLPMAVAREAKEAADKEEAERSELEKQNLADRIETQRLEREKQAEIDAKAAEQLTKSQMATWVAANSNIEDAVVTEDMTKIIGEPCFDDEESRPEILFIGADVKIPADCISELIFASKEALKIWKYDTDSSVVAAIDLACKLLVESGFAVSVGG